MLTAPKLRSSAPACALCLATGAAIGGCLTTPPRPQLVVVVDTDAHVVGELTSRTDVSPDAAMDTLRVDFLDASDSVFASQIFLDVASTSKWPVSFGVLPVD